MKKTLASIVLASLLAAPVAAAPDASFKLSDYKTIGVQPVLAASNTRGVFESQMAAVGAGLTLETDRAAAVAKAASTALDAGQGFGFAGKAQSSDVAMLIIGSTVGMLPAAMKFDGQDVKPIADELQTYVARLDGKVAPDVIKALNLALASARARDVETTAKAVLVAMALSADSIQKGSERAHGYLATGLYAGIATLWTAAGAANAALADIARPLVMLLEEDAAMGGADRAVAAQLKLVAGELRSATPSDGKVLAAIQAMTKVKPD